jgi:hypothetical protein
VLCASSIISRALFFLSLCVSVAWGQEGHLYYFNTRQDDKPVASFFLPSYRMQVEVRAVWRVDGVLKPLPLLCT